MNALPGFWLFVAAAAALLPQQAEPAEHIFGGPEQAQGFSVRVVSQRAGLTFADAETPEARVRVTGAAGATVVNCRIREAEGPWTEHVVLEMPAGGSETPLPLNLPGRGLYTLEVEAVSGCVTAAAQTRIAVLFPARPPEAASPWGIFYVRPLGETAGKPSELEDTVDNIRRLGASWVRLNWWSSAYGPISVSGAVARADGPTYWRVIARELKRQGLYVMGEFAMCPPELSSRPQDTARSGDAGPGWARVKPADYGLWGAVVAQIARDFADSIGTWEIWNEPDLPDAYWRGTAEEFVEHVAQTAAVIRRGNPSARVAAAGFCSTGDFARRCFELGMGRHIDILSFHYTDEREGGVAAWRELAESRGLKLELWNTEERSEVPLNNLAQGVKKNFKFIHVNVEAEHQPNYEEYRPLVEKDLTARPPAVWFSVGAHCIGAAEYVGGGEPAPGVKTYFFRRAGGRVCAIAVQPRKLFGKPEGSLELKAVPLFADAPVTVTDRWGRSRPVELKNGSGRVPLSSPLLFINGAAQIEITGATVTETAGNIIHVPAAGGRRSAGWNEVERPEFSERKLLDIWAEEEPNKAGYWVELEFEAPEEGVYEMLFSGNALSRLRRPRSLSTFAWSLNDEQEGVAADALTVLQVPGAPEGLSMLGRVRLRKGRNVFRMKLLDRRETPDKRYALWFAGLVFRPL